MACAKCHPACSKMLRQFAPVHAITRPFDSKIHPVGAIRANRRLLCATWWLVCAKGRQLGLNLQPLGATCRLYKYRPSATWFRPSSASVLTTSLLNIYNFDMSEAFDNVGVMMLLHQKMMRDAEVATAYLAVWREISLAQLGARHDIPVDPNRRIVCAKGRYVRAIWCHLALIARCKWRDENFKHFDIFLPPHSNLVLLRATTSQLGGSLSHYTPLGTLLATLGATVNCICANWHQLALAQWTPSIRLPLGCTYSTLTLSLYFLAVHLYLSVKI